jgi:hypothetical protein
MKPALGSSFRFARQFNLAFGPEIVVLVSSPGFGHEFGFC